MNKPIIKSKVVKHGNGYALTIPKALLDCQIIDKDKRYKITVEEVAEIPESIKKDVSESEIKNDKFGGFGILPLDLYAEGLT